MEGTLAVCKCSNKNCHLVVDTTVLENGNIRILVYDYIHPEIIISNVEIDKEDMKDIYEFSIGKEGDPGGD